MRQARSPFFIFDWERACGVYYYSFFAGLALCAVGYDSLGVESSLVSVFSSLSGAAAERVGELTRLL